MKDHSRQRDNTHPSPKKRSAQCFVHLRQTVVLESGGLSTRHEMNGVKEHSDQIGSYRKDPGTHAVYSESFRPRSETSALIFRCSLPAVRRMGWR